MGKNLPIQHAPGDKNSYFFFFSHESQLGSLVGKSFQPRKSARISGGKGSLSGSLIGSQPCLTSSVCVPRLHSCFSLGGLTNPEGQVCVAASFSIPFSEMDTTETKLEMDMEMKMKRTKGIDMTKKTTETKMNMDMEMEEKGLSK